MNSLYDPIRSVKLIQYFDFPFYIEFQSFYLKKTKKNPILIRLVDIFSLSPIKMFLLEFLRKYARISRITKIY